MAGVAAERPALEAQSIRESVSRQRLILVMAGVMLGMLLAALDQTVVGTALPRIVADLGGLNHYAWVVTAYLLASTVMVPIYGKLSDIYGRRIFFLGGMILFLLGSALAGMSQSMVELILFRGIQGLGAGAMMPIAQAIIGDVFPPAERGKWQGLMMAVFGLATIVGPTLGGWLTDNWGWRWVFYVNMPVGLIAIVTTGIALPKQSRHQGHQIDYLGSAALIAGTVPLLLAFSWGGSEYAWGSVQIIALLVWSVIALAAFFVIESRVAEPVLSPALFRNNVFSVSVIATFLAAAGMYGGIIYLPLFIQGVIGESATNSGAVLTPMMLGFMVTSIIAGQIMSRTGRYKILALVGFAIAVVGFVLLSQMGVDTSSATVIRNMIVVGLGIGVAMSLFTIVVQNAFPFRQIGEVTASLQFFRSIGGTIGVAILGTVMTTRFQSTFDSKLPADVQQQVPGPMLATLHNPQALLSADATAQMQHAFAALGSQGQALFDQTMQALRSSLAVAITDLFIVTAIAMSISLLATFFLREIPLRKHNKDEATSEQTLVSEPF